MARILTLFLFLVSLIGLVSAGAPTFCKCTCFKNSTIIPMGPKSQSDGSSASSLRRSVDLFTLPQHEVDLDRRTASTSCSDCTKAFCLGQGIDICKDAEEDDVVTMCFQRDSNKDRIIVWGFILGTTGLFGWALVKKVMAWREARAFTRQDINYAPVPVGR